MLNPKHQIRKWAELGKDLLGRYIKALAIDNSISIANSPQFGPAHYHLLEDGTGLSNLRKHREDGFQIVFFRQG